MEPRWNDAKLITPLDIPLVELGQALTRVGHTPVAQLRWLISFAERESLGDLYGVRLLELFLDIITFGSEEEEQGLQRLEWALVPKGYTLEQLVAKLPSDAAGKVTAIHGEVRRMFGTLFGSDVGFYERVVTVAFRASRIRFPPMKEKLASFPTSRIVARMTGRLDDEFIVRALTLMSGLGDRLLRCEAAGCGRLFVANKTQQFCSARCAQRVRTSRFRKKHPDTVKDMRHAAYVKQVQKKHPKAKVERRKRKGSR